MRQQHTSSGYSVVGKAVRHSPKRPHRRTFTKVSLLFFVRHVLQRGWDMAPKALTLKLGCCDWGCPTPSTNSVPTLRRRQKIAVAKGARTKTERQRKVHKRRAHKQRAHKRRARNRFVWGECWSTTVATVVVDGNMLLRVGIWT